jgi:hypothetical protein
MDDIDPSVGHDLGEFAMMMRMNEREFARYLETQRTLRERLLLGRVDKEKT